MKIQISEYILGLVIVSLFLVHIFGFLDQGMMYSGMITTLACGFLVLIWNEKAKDERDEFIRAKTDRYLFLFTLSAIIFSIIWKTFSHEDYFDELLFLSVLSILKLFLAKFLNERH